MTKRAKSAKPVTYLAWGAERTDDGAASIARRPSDKEPFVFDTRRTARSYLRMWRNMGMTGARVVRLVVTVKVA